MQDFNYLFSNCIEITIEISCCKYPQVGNLTLEWVNNVDSILGYLEMAHMGIKGNVLDKSTMKPIPGTTTTTIYLLNG
jgi:hypothetical protein